LWGFKRHIVYQRNPIYFSHWFAKKLGPKGALEHYLRAFYVYFLMKSSTVTVVPSDAMKTMILDYFQELSQLRFKTIYHAFDFAHYQTEADPTLTAKLPLGVPVFLYPTHIAMHKGMDILLKGLAEFKEIYGPKFCCVITAFLDEWSQGKAELIDLIRKNKIEENVIFIGKVSQRQMGYLYQKATAMVYPSVLESFGFSMIEALNFKLPIVASDTLVNREICRNGALYYPVFEPRLLALALQKLLNDETRKELVNGGIEALKRRDWGWSAYVEEFVKLLMDVNVSS
jgi:glycosyltransferase involved in cell wall biosynthesis